MKRDKNRRSYAARALDALAPHADATRVKTLAYDLAQFQAANPDCNAQAMQAELIRFLRELVAADGVLDEREELALEAIERVLDEQNQLTLSKVGEGLADISKAAGSVAAEAASYRQRRTSGPLAREELGSLF